MKLRLFSLCGMYVVVDVILPACNGDFFIFVTFVNNSAWIYQRIFLVVFVIIVVSALRKCAFWACAVVSNVKNALLNASNTNDNFLQNYFDFFTLILTNLMH